MQIFLSYASEDRELADKVYLALSSNGHQVFFDRESLQPGKDYHGPIHAAVESSDIFIFLISDKSVEPGSYALTELKYARSKWRHPKGKVLPVLVRPVEWKRVPPYLAAVTVLQPEGDVPAEILSAVDRLGREGRPQEPALVAPSASSIQSSSIAERAHKVIIGAVICLLGGIGAAVISWDRLFPGGEPYDGSPVEHVGCYDPNFVADVAGTERPRLPAGTGWIFAGYLKEEEGNYRWADGPYVTFADQQLPEARPTGIEKLDVVVLRDSRKVAMVDFGSVGDCSFDKSPIEIPGGKLRPKDHTGVTLPKGAVLKVQDVSSGHFFGNPYYVVWLRVSYATLDGMSVCTSFKSDRGWTLSPDGRRPGGWIETNPDGEQIWHKQANQSDEYLFLHREGEYEGGSGHVYLRVPRYGGMVGWKRVDRDDYQELYNVTCAPAISGHRQN